MATVFDVIHKVGEDLPGSWITAKASTGSTAVTTKAIDPLIGGSDDAYVKGTIIVFNTGGGVAPQGQSRIITDYEAATGTVVITDAFTQGVVSGARFGIIKPRYRRELIVGKMNDMLGDIMLPEEDDTLVTLTDTTDYELPAAVNKTNLLQVWLATEDAEPWEWRRLFHYNVEHDTLNSKWYLRFDQQYMVGHKLRLKYWAKSGPFYLDADVLDPRINLSLIAAKTLRAVLEWHYGKFSTPPERITNALNAALRREAEAEGTYGIKLPKETPMMPMLPKYSHSQQVPYPDVG